jgi:CDP-glucose 4,6-dehydratase
MAINSNFWAGRSVFITGLTGFKGGWLAMWLANMGANVHGYSRQCLGTPNLYSAAKIESLCGSSTIGDVQDLESLRRAIALSRPSVIFHLAAQPLVRHSYIDPLDTFETNVNGTVNILEIARESEEVRAVIIVTSDKCYENTNIGRPFTESDKLGGNDPYSASKACAEIVSQSYIKSYFNDLSVGVASVRAGNVIGGGDWSLDRLIPDIFDAIFKDKTLQVRSPDATRPWQHVLEPLSGYLILAERLVRDGQAYNGAWNFGPSTKNIKDVNWIVSKFIEKYENFKWSLDLLDHPHEAQLLSVDSAKAHSELGWCVKWDVDETIEKTIEWYEAHKDGKNMLNFSLKQISGYSG